MYRKQDNFSCVTLLTKNGKPSEELTFNEQNTLLHFIASPQTNSSSIHACPYRFETEVYKVPPGLRNNSQSRNGNIWCLATRSQRTLKDSCLPISNEKKYSKKCQENQPWRLDIFNSVSVTVPFPSQPHLASRRGVRHTTASKLHQNLLIRKFLSTVSHGGWYFLTKMVYT